jgi:hypothetical protein
VKDADGSVPTGGQPGRNSSLKLAVPGQSKPGFPPSPSPSNAPQERKRRPSYFAG